MEVIGNKIISRIREKQLIYNVVDKRAGQTSERVRQASGSLHLHFVPSFFHNLYLHGKTWKPLLMKLGLSLPFKPFKIILNFYYGL